MNFTVFILTLFVFGAASSADSGRFYVLKPGYRLNSTQYRWSNDVLRSTLGSIPNFKINSGNVTLQDDELLKTNWQFELRYWNADGSGYGDVPHPGQSPSERLSLIAKYRRTGPLAQCKDKGYGGEYFIEYESDGWLNTWDFISVRPSILFKSTADLSAKLPAQTSANPDRSPYTVKNPMENGCRNVYETTFTWEHIEKHLDSTFAGLKDNAGTVDNLTVEFDIQFVSQTDNLEKIRLYNAAVAKTKL